MSDYGDLPERIAAAIAGLIDAERRASPQAHHCDVCRRSNTMRVHEAEQALLYAIRSEYVETADLIDA